MDKKIDKNLAQKLCNEKEKASWSFLNLIRATENRATDQPSCYSPMKLDASQTPS